MNEPRPFDIVLWGATGFTGRLAVDYMHRAYANSNVKWAIAGRNPSKLEAIDSARGLTILTADANDPDSLRQLVAQTRVILTTVGPYARYGSELVAACAEGGTHYCDLTGEVHWIRDMIDRHQQTAEKSGAIIVPTCGFDSIPSDIGVYCLQRAMLETTHGIPSPHIRYRTREMSGGFSGGTLDSMMAMMEQAETDPSLFDLMADPYNLNDDWRGLDGLDNTRAFYDADFKSWIAPFVMAPINTRVVRRSNELLGMRYGHEFRYEEGMAVGDGVQGRLTANGLSIGLSAMQGLPRFGPTRRLMQRMLPKPGEGPSEDAIRNGYFNIEMLAKHPSRPDGDMRLNIHGDEDPGYGATARMLAECAVCLAQDELPVGGGFWTPASAMGDQLLARLPDNAGITFDLS